MRLTSVRATRPFILRYFSILALLVTVGPLAIAKDPRLGACSEGFIALTLKDDGTGRKKIQVTPQFVAHLDGMRHNLRSAMNTINTRYKEMDHVTRRLFLARMMQTHAHISGPPGSAKSAITNAVQNMPIFNRHRGEFVNDVWAIQLHQLVGDAAFKGYVDYEAIKAKAADLKKGLREEHIQNAGTMVHAEVAIVDELEKGNPIAFATLLDVLNEKVARYGAVTVKVRTKTVAVTSNMSVYEFVAALKELGLESTAKPFLDRLVFKVFAHNYVTDPKLREQLMREQEERDEAEADNLLENPLETQTAETAKILMPGEDGKIELPYVDFVWLGLLAKKGMAMDEATTRKMQQLMDGLRSDYNDLRATTEAEKAKDKENAPPVYYPPFIFSTRNMMQYGTNTVKTDMLIDLMLMENNQLSSKELAKMLSDGIVVHPTSIYRLHNLVTTAAAGDPSINVAADGTKFELQYGPQIEKLAEHPLDSNERALLGYLIQERALFRGRFESLIDTWKQEDTAGSDILASFASIANLETQRQQTDVEQRLFQANRRAGRR